jgi:transposase
VEPTAAFAQLQLGVDLVAIPGLNASTAQTILSEIGLGPWKWPNAKAFCSWLGLAPHHEISGGKCCAGAP